MPLPWAQVVTHCRQTCPFPHCPATPRGARCPGVGSRGRLRCCISLPAESIDGPFLGVCAVPGCCPVGPAVRQRRCKGVGWQEGLCSNLPGSGSLWLFPHLAGAQDWPGHGWCGDNPVPTKAAPRPRSRLVDAASLEHRGALVPHSSLPRTGSSRWESTVSQWGGFCPGSQLGACSRRDGAGCRGSRRR